MNVTEKDFDAFFQATESLMAMSGTLDEGFDEEAHAINRQFKSFKRRYLKAKEEEKMNEEILKEAVNFGATIGNRWDKYTDGGRLFFLSKLFALCREAKKQVEKSSVTDFERGSWLLIQSRIIQKLESVATVEMIKTANFSKQKMIELENDSGGQYLKEVETFIKIFMED